jgi:hypothetical protein
VISSSNASFFLFLEPFGLPLPASFNPFSSQNANRINLKTVIHYFTSFYFCYLLAFLCLYCFDLDHFYFLNPKNLMTRILLLLIKFPELGDHLPDFFLRYTHFTSIYNTSQRKVDHNIMSLDDKLFFQRKCSQVVPGFTFILFDQS